MITHIEISDKIHQQYTLDGGSSFWSNLNKINILIGANNSGKSRFMREIAATQNSKVQLAKFQTQRLTMLFQSVLDSIERSPHFQGYKQISATEITDICSSLKENINDLNQCTLENSEAIGKNIKDFWAKLSSARINYVCKLPQSSAGES